MKIETIVLDEKTNTKLTIYVQEPSSEMKDVSVKKGILILPGGGYQMCSDRESEPIALSYLQAGYNAFVLEYSLKEDSRFPKPLKDAEQALLLIREHASAWHVDPDKIACIGFSAGGHLASHLGASDVARPNALLLGYGAFIRSDGHGWSYPTVQVDAKFPPSFLFHTYEDGLVPVDTSLWLALELSKHKVPFDLHVFTKGVHGLSLGTDSVTWGEGYQAQPRFAEWLKLSLSWLDEIL
jgi:acetyl esterase/lipase